MNYFLTFIYYTAWIISILALGILTVNIFKRFKIIFESSSLLIIAIYGFYGFIFIYLFASILNFFIPVNFIISHIFLVTGISLFFLYRRKIFSFFKNDNLPAIFFLFIFNSFIPFRWLLYYDTGLYHLQMIKWIAQSKVPLGLSNLYYAFGTNSSWFNIHAVIEQPALLLKAPFFISNSIFLFFYGIGIIFAFKELINKNFKLSNIFLALTLIPYLFNAISSWSSSTCYDLPVAFLILFLIFLTISYFENAVEETKNNILLIITFAIFAITIKISSVPLILLPLLVIVLKIIKKDTPFHKDTPIISAVLSFFILVPWIFKNIFISGYLLFPVTFTKIPILKWATPQLIAIQSLAAISSVAKTGQDRTTNEILNNFNWVNGWFKRLILYDKIIIILIVLCALLLIILLFRKNNKKINYLSLFVPLLVSGIGIIFWLLNAPDLRFGQGFVFSFLLILISYAIYRINFVLKINSDELKQKRKNKLKFVLLFLGLFIILYSILFLFLKDFQSLLLDLLSMMRKKEISALGLIRLKTIVYIFSSIGLLVILWGTYYFKNKKAILISAIIISILFSLMITKGFLYYEKEYRIYPTSSIFPEIILIKAKTIDGNIINIPEKGDQTWDAALPSAPALDKKLKISYAKNGLPIMFWFEN
jgi:hypothetical protein